MRYYFKLRCFVELAMGSVEMLSDGRCLVESAVKNEYLDETRISCDALLEEITTLIQRFQEKNKGSLSVYLVYTNGKGGT